MALRGYDKSEVQAHLERMSKHHEQYHRMGLATPPLPIPEFRIAWGGLNTGVVDSMLQDLNELHSAAPRVAEAGSVPRQPTFATAAPDALLGGYAKAEVDAMIPRLNAALDGSNEFTSMEVDEMGFTEDPEGYDVEEVDEYLYSVGAVLRGVYGR